MSTTVSKVRALSGLRTFKVRNRSGAVFGLFGAIAAISVGCSAKSPQPSEQGAPILSSKSTPELVMALRRTFHWKQSAKVAKDFPASIAPVIGDGIATDFIAASGGVQPKFDQHPAGHWAAVVIPRVASGILSIEDRDSGLGAQVSLVGATSASATIAGGYLVYPKGHQSGADIVQRPTPFGAEDYLYFAQKPQTEELRYRVTLNAKVAGLRNVGHTVELLDAKGTPRLRVATPLLAGPNGETYIATAAVEGCAADNSPEAPWGRAVTAPGAASCTIRIAWDHSNVTYPALLDPTWSTTGVMANARYGHTATLINGPYILVAGGSSTVTDTELYHPGSNTFATTGALAAARSFHTAIGLGASAGVAGGDNGTTALASIETYQTTGMSAGTWSSAGSLGTARTGHTATLTPGNNKILIAGGSDFGAVHVYSTGDVITVGMSPSISSVSLVQARLNAAAVWLSGSQVLLIGGNDGTSPTATAEIFDTGSGSSSAVSSMSVAREYHAAGLLGNGKVLVAGDGAPELYNVGGDSWAYTSGSINTARTKAAMSVIAGGAILSGGYDGSSYLASAELYDSASQTWLYTANYSSMTWTEADMHAARAGHTSTALADGSIVALGGTSSGGALDSGDIWKQAGPDDPANYRVVCNTGFFSEPAGTTGSCTCGLLTDCDSVCVDVGTDGNNCGTCGNVCLPGRSCVSGGCRCPSGEDDCETAGCCDTDQFCSDDTPDFICCPAGWIGNGQVCCATGYTCGHFCYDFPDACCSPNVVCPCDCDLEGGCLPCPP